MLVVWAIGAAVTYIMLPVNWFMETIGFLAVFTEAMLGELIITNPAPLVLIKSFSTLRTAAIPSKLQKQVHARHELPNGYHVGDW